MTRFGRGLAAALLSLALAGCQQATPVPSAERAPAPGPSAPHTSRPHRTPTTPGRDTSSGRGDGDVDTSTGSGLQPGSTDPVSGLAVVALDDLPDEAGRVLHLVEVGGPFRYRQDGVVYHNVNRVLPRRHDGYYHEYTVPTPGSRTRGARRIVHGNGPEYYWTADHYETFRRIA